MSIATIGKFGADTLSLDRPFVGTWVLRAKLDIGDEPSPSIGPFSCVFDDGLSSIEYIGTIISSIADVGDANVVCVGGNGKLDTLMQGVDYSQPKPSTIARDIIEGCGEVVGDLSTIESLPRIENVYSCVAGRASNQLQYLCEQIGARWFVGVDGKTNIVIDTWPTYSNDAFIVHNPNEYNEIIAEPNIADIDPGMIVDSFRVSRVRYFVDDHGLSARLGVASANG
jgi:hypothetical protein